MTVYNCVYYKTKLLRHDVGKQCINQLTAYQNVHTHMYKCLLCIMGLKGQIAYNFQGNYICGFLVYKHISILMVGCVQAQSISRVFE